LERDAHFLGDGEAMWGVSEEDAGAVGACGGGLQGGTKAFGVRESAIGYADQLKAIDGYGFVEEHSNAAATEGVDVLAGIGEFFMVAGDEKFAERRC